eukprot:828244-Prymnesium_polylepis.2
MANAALSASCAPHTKPAWRTRLAMGSGSSAVTARTSHRADGTSPTASHPHAAKTAAAHCDAAPAGSSALVPSTVTAAATPADVATPLARTLTVTRSGCSTDASCRAVGTLQLVAQLDRAQRVDPRVHQRRIGVDRAARCAPRQLQDRLQ